MKAPKKVNDYVNQIINGAGWTTDQYVLQFAPENFTERDIFHTLKKLALLGILYEESEAAITAMENENFPPRHLSIAPEKIDKNYGGVPYMDEADAAK